MVFSSVAVASRYNIRGAFVSRPGSDRACTLRIAEFPEPNQPDPFDGQITSDYRKTCQAVK